MGLMFGSQDTRMTSDGIRPSRFGEKTLKRSINQVIIDLVAHDKVVEDSPVL